MIARLLLICGSVRSGSVNDAVLRTAAEVAPADLEAVRYDGLADLPHFNPDDDRDPLHPAVADLRARIAYESLATVLAYTDTTAVDGATEHIPVRRDQIDAGGVVADSDLRARIGDVVRTLVEARSKA